MNMIINVVFDLKNENKKIFKLKLSIKSVRST